MFDYNYNPKVQFLPPGSRLSVGDDKKGKQRDDRKTRFLFLLIEPLPGLFIGWPRVIIFFDLKGSQILFTHRIFPKPDTQPLSETEKIFLHTLYREILCWFQKYMYLSCIKKNNSYLFGPQIPKMSNMLLFFLWRENYSIDKD